MTLQRKFKAVSHKIHLSQLDGPEVMRGGETERGILPK